jgi:hypothetical protein
MKQEEANHSMLSPTVRIPSLSIYLSLLMLETTYPGKMHWTVMPLRPYSYDRPSVNLEINGEWNHKPVIVTGKK